MVTLRALILDLGEVLVRAQPPALVARMAEAARVPLPAFTAGYWAHRIEYDRTGSARDYWEAVLRECRSPLDGAGRADALPRLVALDAASWTDYREEVWELAARFRAAGGRTAVLTNCGPEIVDRVKAERDVAGCFDDVVASWEVGCLKPEARIYQLAVARLGVAAGEALFVDDREVNIAGAAAAGLETLHFTGDGSVAALRERLSLPG
jgi:putative hydrolase of the HAD superfamily